jgi:hypothetical protein
MARNLTPVIYPDGVRYSKLWLSNWLSKTPRKNASDFRSRADDLAARNDQAAARLGRENRLRNPPYCQRIDDAGEHSKQRSHD